MVRGPETLVDTTGTSPVFPTSPHDIAEAWHALRTACELLEGVPQSEQGAVSRSPLRVVT